MTRRIYDTNIMNYISIFESLTGAKVKDCLVNDNVTFIIEKGNMGLAIGKGGNSLRRAESVLKKNIRVIEFDDNVAQFIRNYVYPIRAIEVEQDNKTISIKGQDKKTKGFLIGRDKSNLKKMTSIVQRFFDVDNIVVI